MRFKRFLKLFKKHCKSHDSLVIYVDFNTDVYSRILRYVASHHVSFDFVMYPKDCFQYDFDDFDDVDYDVDYDIDYGYGVYDD